MENFSHQTKAGFTLAAGLIIVALLFWIIRWALAKKRRGFIDFLIGDTGKLSIARAQAVAWAFVVIAFQITVILTLLLHTNNEVRMQQFRLEFSDNILWLLGLSLTSYVAVKGIIVNQIAEDKTLYKRHTAKAEDLVTGDNGLDFSKFQMLIWTSLAILLYLGSAYNFITQIYSSNSAADVDLLFNPEKNLIPDIDMSFIVLMGLSQGAYVGKKLIPSFRLESMRVDKQQELEKLKTTLEQKRRAFENIFQKLLPKTDEEHKQAELLKKDIEQLTQEITRIQTTLDEINKNITTNINTTV